MSAEEVVSVFQQVILSLAVAETALKFEHRQLNLDSIFVRRSNHEVIEWKISGKAFYVDNHGVTARIHNFGASRAEIGRNGCYSCLSCM
ncbi:hypothetical protein HPB48_006385 [Haemaphysalis longicornis]|uniref:Uncharacterized protein n=1 Tax=Haemaphysalis longicornis TaxID=44386 RepID=A0A9J6FKE4_HAELO|nr:hypothetical protein HPB48_006385 [Haemaphysalis longicornis]